LRRQLANKKDEQLSLLNSLLLHFFLQRAESRVGSRQLRNKKRLLSLLNLSTPPLLNSCEGQKEELEVRKRKTKNRKTEILWKVSKQLTMGLRRFFDIEK
jgi:hypothetical protein